MVRICNDPYPTNSKWDNYFELFPFPLSDFQKYAIEGIVEGDHVLVTAHTGSGKTLPAEFAIEHFVGQGKKVIYTSPIKALSNQKFFEFSRRYPHISFGLLTGDIKTNPDADVLIMTTEILMNALFVSQGQMDQEQIGQDPIQVQGQMDPDGLTHTIPKTPLQFQIDINQDLACVIFDEVHYINDPDRGQTWEKTILMLPPQIQMVMLSATIDAPERFASWVESTGTKQVYLASTNHRVVPLSHYGYLTIPESTLKLVKDKALEKEIREATHTLLPLQNAAGQFQDQGHRTLAKMTKVFDARQIFPKRKHVLNNLSLFLRDHDMLPAIAFVFSRKQVEQCAQEITVPLLEDDSKVGYTMRRECEQIVRKLPNFREYLELPEYNSLVSLLERGIGIHHSGMIPILREIVEMMIGRKMIKLLFATESFAIGLDCPIKTAVFTGLTKFDGANERWLLSHEYTQMAGRAGRRGIDTVGHVVHCNNMFSLPTATEYKAMLGGKPQALVSKFRISYSFVLNLLKRGQNRLSDFVRFSEQSMVYRELQTDIGHHLAQVADKADALEKAQTSLQYLRCPLETCRAYLAAEEGARTSSNSRRKQYERDMQRIRDEYRSTAEDIAAVRRVDQMAHELTRAQEELEYVQTYIDVQVAAVCRVLTHRGFVLLNPVDEYLSQNPGPSYQWTPLGQIASVLSEIHPLVTAECIQKWNWFQRCSVYQIIGLLACFTDVKVSNECAHSYPHSEDAFLKSRIQDLHDLYRTYEDLEMQEHMHTGIVYENALNYDLPDCAVAWTYCEDERACKLFIQEQLASMGISVGDFTKAMLKISTMAKELSTAAEMAGELECLHKLSQVDELILKYVTTSQSLYV